MNISKINTNLSKPHLAKNSTENILNQGNPARSNYLKQKATSFTSLNKKISLKSIFGFIINPIKKKIAAVKLKNQTKLSKQELNDFRSAFMEVLNEHEQKVKERGW